MGTLQGGEIQAELSSAQENTSTSSCWHSRVIFFWQCTMKRFRKMNEDERRSAGIRAYGGCNLTLPSLQNKVLIYWKNLSKNIVLADLNRKTSQAYYLLRRTK